MDFTFCISCSVLAVIIAIVPYWFLYRELGNSWIRRIRSESANILAVEDRLKKESLKKDGRNQGDHDQTAKHQNRESSMLTMGSIFVVASFVLLGLSTRADLANIFADDLNFLIKIASPLLYGSWLLTIQLSTRIMMDGDIEKELILEHKGHDESCEEIELGPVHLERRIYGGGHGRGWMIRFRRNHWLVYFAIILMVSLVNLRP